MLRGAETFDAIGFGTPSERPLPEEGSQVDLVGTLERDTFQGQPRLRLRVVDFAASSLSPLAARREAARTASLQPVHMAAPARATTA